MNISRKIPRLDDVAPVYAVIVIMLYYPTIIRFFWKFPSWILFSSLGDIFSIYAYMVTVNFLESLLVLVSVLGLCIVLPQKWFYDRFVSRGISLVVLTLGFFIYLGSRMDLDMIFPWPLVRLLPLIFVIIILLVFLIDKVGFLRKVLTEMASHLTVFLYISIPISIISLLVVLARNVS